MKIYYDILLKPLQGKGELLKNLNPDSNSNSEQNKVVQTFTGKGGALKNFWNSNRAVFNSNQNQDSDQDSTFFGTIKKHQDTSKVETKCRNQSRLAYPNFEDEALLFQEGFPLQDEDEHKPQHPDCKIFMTIIGENQEHNNPLEKVDLVDYNSSDYDEFLSDTEAPPVSMEKINYEIPTPSQGVSVTIHLDEDTNEQKKIRN